MSASDDSGTRSDDAERIAHDAGAGVEGLGSALRGLIDDDGPTDSTSEDVQGGFGAASDVAGHVEEGAKAWGQMEDAVDAAEDGNARGVVDGAIGAAGGAAGHVAEGLSAIGNVTNDAGLREAAQVAGAVQAGIGVVAGIAREVGSIVEHVDRGGRERSRHVEYELSIDDASGWVLHDFTATEGLNEPYELVLEVRTDDEDAEPRLLVGRNVEVLIDRREFNRRFCGIIHRVREGSHRSHRVTATLWVVPALWSLSQGSDSRIFQERSVKQILEEVLSAGLAPFQREVDSDGLEHDYPVREYCVQFRESPLAFCHRLMEEEGIGYYFDLDGAGWEKLVLFERNGQLQPASLLDFGPVPFAEHSQVILQSEPIVEMSPSRQLGVTQVHVADFDWTRATSRVEATEGSDDQRVSYEHGHGRTVRHYDFSEGSNRYGQNDVSRQGHIRREAHVRDLDTFGGVSMVTGFTPGRTFEVSGHPSPGVDGEYLVTSVVHHRGTFAREGGHDSPDAEDYYNHFACIPLSVPWRPKALGHRPAIYGVQTALVTGGNNGEIITDAYGRVRVQFHWDRDPDPQRTSCWVRVAQTWGGHDGQGHTGFVFIPRVGMEVIVTFVDGDPDRPLVTGSVYNGTNLPPIGLPDEATRSVIRTRSTQGTGFNELSFEDASGNEEVHLHAQRNLREIVRHDHMTKVHNNQSIEVEKNQETRVKGMQEIHVEIDRLDVVLGDEEHAVHGDRTTMVGVRKGGTDRLHAHGDQEVQIDRSRALTIGGNDDQKVELTRRVVIDGGLEQTVKEGLTETVETGGVNRIVQDGGLYTTTVGGVSHQSIGDRQVTVSGTNTETATGVFTIEGDQVILRAGTKVVIDAPQGIDKIGTGSNVEQRTQWDIAADNVSEMVSVMKASFVGIKVSDAAIKIAQEGITFNQGSLKITEVGFKLDIIKTVNILGANMTLIG